MYNMKYCIDEAYELSKLSHEKMFEKLNNMTEDELNILRAISTYPYMIYTKELAERAAYVDTTVVTLLRVRHQEHGRND